MAIQPQKRQLPQNLQNLNLQDYYRTAATNNPYALNTNTQAIKQVYDQATAAAHAAEERSIINAENAWQRNLANTQQTALDTIRKNNASAIATGASKGMQAANELSAVLGLQDTATEEATALAQQRIDLADKYAAEYAKNAVTAQEMANANKSAMLGQALSAYSADLNAATNLQNAIYAAESQDYASELSNEAQRYMAQKSFEADQYTADTEYSTQKEYAQIMADAELGAADLAASASRYGYDRQKEAQEILAQSNVDASKFNNESYALLYAAIDAKNDGDFNTANALFDALGIDLDARSVSVGALAAEEKVEDPKYAYPAGTSIDVDTGFFKGMRDSWGINSSIKDSSGNTVGTVVDSVYKGDFKKTLEQKAGLSKGKIVFYNGKWYTEGTLGQVFEVNLTDTAKKRIK